MLDETMDVPSLSLVIPVYNAATTATQSALGAAGSFAALLVWVYWSSQIFLLGAALAVELGHPAAAAHDPVVAMQAPDTMKRNIVH